MENNITYYKTRLELVRELFKDHQLELLKKNVGVIKNLVEEYNTFRNHRDYDHILAEFPQTFIFN